MDNEIETLPELLFNAVSSLDDFQLDTPYRKDGCTVRQVVHHIPDSHLNAYIRFKLALTEDAPVIKPYSEAMWAKLPDSLSSITVSMQLTKALHRKWVDMLSLLIIELLKKTFFHPEHNKLYSLEEVLGLYAWHGNHHVAHITTLKKRMLW